MTKVTLTQFSFNRGELSPALHARGDWKYHGSGAETLRNLIVRPQGGATKRGGLRFVAPALDEGCASWFIPFRFSASQSYLLELSDRKMRVLRDGGVVAYPAGHDREGEEVVLDTPYPAEALPLLRHAQSADVMILTHPGFPPQRLSRHDHHDWRLERLLTGARTAAPAELSLTESGRDNARYVVTATSVAGGESAPTRPVIADEPETAAQPTEDMSFAELHDWLSSRDPSRIPEGFRFAGAPWNELLNRLVAAGYLNLERLLVGNGYRWAFRRPGSARDETMFWTDADYAVLVNECLYAVEQGWIGAGAADKAALWEAVRQYIADSTAGLAGTRLSALSWTPVPGAESYRVYRDRAGGGFGPYYLIGETAATSFRDDDLPSQTSRLPEEYNLFAGAGDYPGVCAFFEQRLVLGRSDNKPTSFWGSETGAYNSFIRHSPIEDSDSYEFTLASGEMNEIHWIVPLNEMLLGTGGGEWKAGGGGGAITPSNINARIQSWYGCSPLPPLVVGRSVVFAGRSGKTLRDFAYSLEADGYSGRDLTGYASHLFVNREIVGLCYQQEPSGVIWVVMSDGALLSCTYAPDEGVVAWSRHETRGRVEACASLVDVDGSDQVYFVVARDIGGATRRFIETLEDAADAVRDESEGFFLDCALGYSGAPTGRVTGLDHLEGERVDCLADGAVFTGLAVRDGAVDLPDGFTAAVIRVGLPYEARLVTLDLEPEAKETMRNRARFAVSAAVRLLASRECLYSHSDGRLSEMKFRTTEAPGRAARLFTGEKNVVFSSPPGARTTRLSFVSRAPTPLTILGIVMEASYGQPA